MVYSLIIHYPPLPIPNVPDPTPAAVPAHHQASTQPALARHHSLGFEQEARKACSQDMQVPAVADFYLRKKVVLSTPRRYRIVASLAGCSHLCFLVSLEEHSHLCWPVFEVDLVVSQAAKSRTTFSGEVELVFVEGEALVGSMAAVRRCRSQTRRLHGL
jgi:hypothetical protein